jgi:hypothetical protein
LLVRITRLQEHILFVTGLTWTVDMEGRAINRLGEVLLLCVSWWSGAWWQRRASHARVMPLDVLQVGIWVGNVAVLAVCALKIYR